MAYHGCPHCPGIICERLTSSCTGCGWEPKEAARRQRAIRAGKFSKDDEERIFLLLRRRRKRA